jgi:16S rRNA (guanine527-N7)-methyltransferase
MAATGDPRIGGRVIVEVFERYGLASVTPKAVEQLEAYLDLLVFWNSRQNLTAIRDRETIISRHFVESAFCAQALPQMHTVLDFGSGAGFPGIPIAILRPEMEVTLGESQGKKAAFLREAVRTLELSTKVYAGRVETLSPATLFDCVTMRAVDKTMEMLPYAWNRVKDSGRLILFSTNHSAEPIRSGIQARSWAELSIPGPLVDGILLFADK